MVNKDKQKIAERLSARVATGLYFIEFNYLDHHSRPDPAWIRNVYILLSFYTELLLKQVFVLTKQFSDVDDLDKKFRKFGHNLKALSDEIGEIELSKLGIQKVNFANHEYLLETDKGSFPVKDFTDIRYDFLDDNVRSLKGDEHNLFKIQIEKMLDINKCLKLMI